MALPFWLFMGGPVMPGTQWISWIHRDDWVGLVEWVLTNSTVSGPVNMVAPHPVRMMEFCRTLGVVLHRPSWFPVPELVLRGALGELASLLTTGQRAVPAMAQQGGYRFRHPLLEGALRAIYTKT
jgi:NAD dependent epimerase/dehydratase family enzyme